MEMITADPIDMQMMIFMDPPEHTRYRRLVSKAFTPRRMKLLEDDIRALCVDLLDGLVGRSSFDYVQDFGARVPAYVIAALLGVPPEDRDMVRGWIDESFHLDPETGMSNDISATAMFSVMDYVGKTLADRQANPRDDMFTDLVNMEITEEDGVPRRLTLGAGGQLRRAHRQRRHGDGGPHARLGRLGARQQPRPAGRARGRRRA